MDKDMHLGYQALDMKDVYHRYNTLGTRWPRDRIGRTKVQIHFEYVEDSKICAFLLSWHTLHYVTPSAA